MPAVEFDDLVDDAPDPRVDQLVSQLVVKGAVVDGPGGVAHPALVFTGQDAERRRLPQWVYVASDAQLRQAVTLVRDMTELAIRRTDEQNGARRG